MIEGEEKQFRLTAAGALATVMVEAHRTQFCIPFAFISISLFAMFLAIFTGLFDLAITVAFIPTRIVGFFFILVLVRHSILSNTLSELHRAGGESFRFLGATL